MSNKHTYQILLVPDGKNEPWRYAVFVPEYPGVFTEENSIEKCKEMAIDAIETMTEYLLSEGKEVPLPTGRAIPHKKNEIVTTVTVDFDKIYRRLEKNKVKKTVEIPEYLYNMATAQKINLSKFLQANLKKSVL